MQKQSFWRTMGWPVYLVLALLIVFLLVVIVELVAFQPPANTAPATLTANTYMEEVTPLLANANPANAPALFEKYQCAVCHVAGAGNGLAPSLDGIAQRASTRRPPLTAAAYLYESIIHPTAYVVEGYGEIMPQNFRERLTDQELGDLIAYLLTL
jgi:cytochrome c